MSYIGNEPIVSATRTITEITATAGQTVFTANGGYTVGYIDVFVNGAQLQTSDFTATDGSTITLISGASAGDDIRLVAWGTFNSANLNGSSLVDGSVTPVKLSTGAPSWDSSGNLSFNSGYGSTARAYGCRAWVNFNGTGTVAIRASGNVSSITDFSVGDYAINFTTAMPDTNYAPQISGSDIGYGCVGNITTLNTSSFRLATFNNQANANGDPAVVSVAVYR